MNRVPRKRGRNERKIQLLKCVRLNPGETTGWIADILDLPRTHAGSYLLRYLKQGLVERKRAGQTFRWYITEAGREYLKKKGEL